MFILYAVIRLEFRLDVTLNVPSKHAFGTLSKYTNVALIFAYPHKWVSGLFA